MMPGMVKYIREQKIGLTQVRLAKALNIEGGERTIKRWEAVGSRGCVGPAEVILTLAVEKPEICAWLKARAK